MVNVPTGIEASEPWIIGAPRCRRASEMPDARGGAEGVAWNLCDVVAHLTGGQMAYRETAL